MGRCGSPAELDVTALGAIGGLAEVLPEDKFELFKNDAERRSRRRQGRRRRQRRAGTGNILLTKDHITLYRILI